MSRRIVWILIAIVGVAAALVLLRPAPGPDTLRIGAIMPLTGRFASMGTPIKDAMDLAVDEINAAGGIKGKKLEIVYADSQGDPKQGVTGAQKLIDVDRVQVLTTFLTGVSEAVKPIAEQRKILLLAQTVSPTIVKDTHSTVRMHYSFLKDGELLASHLSAVGKQPVGFLRSRDPSTSYEVEQVVIPAIRKAGITDVVDETFDLGTKDFRPQALRLKEAGVKQICMLGYGTDFPGILRALHEVGILAGAELSGNLGLIELPPETPPELVANITFSTPPFLVAGAATERVTAFESAYRARFKATRIGYSAYYAYDTIYLLRDAAMAAPSFRAADLRAAIVGRPFPLMTGDYRFSTEGDAHPPAVLGRYEGGLISQAQ